MAMALEVLETGDREEGATCEALKTLVRATLEEEWREALSTSLPLLVAHAASPEPETSLYALRTLRNASAGAERTQAGLAEYVERLLDEEVEAGMFAGEDRGMCRKRVTAMLQMAGNVCCAQAPPPGRVYGAVWEWMGRVVGRGGEEGEDGDVVDGAVLALCATVVIRVLSSLDGKSMGGEGEEASLARAVAGIVERVPLGGEKRVVEPMVQMVELMALEGKGEGLYAAAAASAAVGGGTCLRALLEVVDGLVFRAQEGGGVAELMTPGLWRAIMRDVVEGVSVLATSRTGEEAENQAGVFKLQLQVLGMVLGCVEGEEIKEDAANTGVLSAAIVFLRTLRESVAEAGMALSSDTSGSGIPQGLMGDIVRIVGNASADCKRNQDLVREEGGLLLILDSCRIDTHNPFIREWALLAVRNLVVDNEENQKEVAGLEMQGVAETRELADMGLEAYVDEHGKLKFKR